MIMKPYLLIAASEDGIDYTDYETEKEARDAMRNAYEACTPSEWEPEWEEDSYLEDWSAKLYANGEQVYDWEIIQTRSAETMYLEPVREKPETIIPAYLDCVILPTGEVVHNGKSLGWIRDFITDDMSSLYRRTSNEQTNIQALVEAAGRA